jgi:hypothetical protein
MLGNRLAARFSATLRKEIDLVNFDEPIAFCLLPETGLGFRAPPRPSLILTTTIPGLALYPRRRAVGRLVGRGIRLMTGSRLHVIAERLSQSLNSAVLSCHDSAMYEYAMEQHSISSSPGGMSDKGY